MQEPIFKLSPEMEAEINAELDRAATGHGQESHDLSGERPRSVSLRRRTIGAQDSGSPASRSEDDQAVPEDPINPAHYRKHPSGIECIEVVRHMSFNVGNAIKYIWRYMDKGDPIENLKKAQWYLDDEIRRLSK